MRSYIIQLFLIAILFASCAKPETIRYAEKDAAISFFYLHSTEIDSVNYSFANQVSTKTKDTIFLKMRLNGMPVGRPRAIEVVAAEGTTAKEGVDFILPKINLPADSFNVLYPVVVLNTTKLLDTTFKIIVKVVESKDLKPGAVGKIGADILTKNVNQYKIYFTARLIKPDFDWDYVAGYFGSYSDVKYKFMIQHLKISDYRPTSLGGTLTNTDLLSLGQKIGIIWRQYVAANGPLLDENNEEVTFPM